MPIPKHILESKLMLEDAEALVTPYPGRTFADNFPQVLSGAQSSVEVIMYQWKWDRFEPKSYANRFTQTILDLARKGVKIRVLMNIDSPNSRLTAVNGMTKKELEKGGCLVKMTGRSIAVHSKIWMIDDDKVCLGSHNISKRALVSNVETSLLVKSKDCCNEFKRYFNLLWDSC